MNAVFIIMIIIIDRRGRRAQHANTKQYKYISHSKHAV